VSARSKSSGRWLQEHFSDPFVQRAKSQGWRSRAVFKLEEIDRREKLLRAGQVCVDLGAAPGAWSQYALNKVGKKGRVIATDLLEVPSLPGVEFVRGDFRESEVLAAVRAHLSELALELAGQVLKGRGAALIKVFQGAGFEELVRAARRQFGTVKLLKPQASRARSPELYLLAKAFVMV